MKYISIASTLKKYMFKCQILTLNSKRTIRDINTHIIVLLKEVLSPVHENFSSYIIFELKAVVIFFYLRFI